MLLYRVKRWCIFVRLVLQINEIGLYTVIRYFIAQGYLTRIFRGIFYVKTLDELKLGRSKYSYLELAAKGL